MKPPTSRRIITGLLAACTLTALTLPSASAASATSEPAVPSGCSVGAYGITPEGETIQYRYDDAGATSEPLGFTTPLPFQPVFGTTLETDAVKGSYERSELLMAADGTLYDRRILGTDDRGAWTHTQAVYAVGAGFDRAVDLEWSAPYLYQLNKWGAGIRYEVSNLTASAGGEYTTPKLENPTPIKWSLANKIRMLSYIGESSHELTADGSERTWDVFYAVTREGGLAQVEIAQDDPQIYTYSLLRESGFRHVTRLSTGWCVGSDGEPQPQVLMAIEAKGSARVYYDADPMDDSGADLVGGDVVVSKNFTNVVLDY